MFLKKNVGYIGNCIGADCIPGSIFNIMSGSKIFC
jgi:hypothetical protein